MYNIVCKGPGKAALPHENEYNLLSNMILTTGIIVLQERKTLATVDHTQSSVLFMTGFYDTILLSLIYYSACLEAYPLAQISFRFNVYFI